MERTMARSGKDGARRTRSQKYQNTFAYKHNTASKRTQEILAKPIGGVCRRCAIADTRTQNPYTHTKPTRVGCVQVLRCADVAQGVPQVQAEDSTGKVQHLRKEVR